MEHFAEALQPGRADAVLAASLFHFGTMRIAEVKEYLHGRGALKGLGGSELRRRTGEVMEGGQLEDVRRKIIGNLSKGFRQRVALADALLGRPPLLILDEPTNGLDPNQIRHIRQLLHAFKSRQTILLSTHILSEIEASCDRILLLHHGKLRANDTPQNLVRKLRVASDVHVELTGGKDHATLLSQINGVRKVTEDKADSPWLRFTLRVEARADIRESLFDMALKNKWQVRELHRELPRLEDVFVELTMSDH